MCGYSWRVPADLELADKRETFAAAVTYDTRDLYEKVEASWNIVLVSD